MKVLPGFVRVPALGLAAASSSLVSGAEQTVASPDGRVVVVIISDTAGLRYRVSLDGQPAVVDSRLGLDLRGGLSLGRAARIVGATSREHDASWENPFGPRHIEPDRHRELKLELQEAADAPVRFNLFVRAYDNGIALRYEIPDQPGLETFLVTDELTEFVFPSDLKCRSGNPSSCAGNQNPERHLTQLNAGPASRHVPPLLVQTPRGYAAITESDLIDWAGMALVAVSPGADGQPRPGAKVALARRGDGHGLVFGHERRLSPWRVIMLARDAAGLLTNNLVATLATPSRLADTSSIKPGISAWDARWAGVHPSQPGVYSRGDTRSDRGYIDFARP